VSCPSSRLSLGYPDRAEHGPATIHRASWRRGEQPHLGADPPSLYRREDLGDLHPASFRADVPQRQDQFTIPVGLSYMLGDLFPPQGMLAADRELTEHFHYGPVTYQGLFLPGSHRFDREMQDAVKSFLLSSL
jgi:hypothetical protein